MDLISNQFLHHLLRENQGKNARESSKLSCLLGYEENPVWGKLIAYEKLKLRCRDMKQIGHG